VTEIPRRCRTTRVSFTFGNPGSLHHATCDCNLRLDPTTSFVFGRFTGRRRSPGNGPHPGSGPLDGLRRRHFQIVLGLGHDGGHRHALPHGDLFASHGRTTRASFGLGLGFHRPRWGEFVFCSHPGLDLQVRCQVEAVVEIYPRRM
ncbi:hypothetical protein H2204_004368, partial [Knufia peltigerae]